MDIAKVSIDLTPDGWFYVAVQGFRAANRCGDHRVAAALQATARERLRRISAVELLIDASPSPTAFRRDDVGQEFNQAELASDKETW